jgi:hypothetical protein
MDTYFYSRYISAMTGYIFGYVLFDGIPPAVQECKG